MSAEQLADILSTPLEELLVSLGRGIGRSQAELDLHSIEIQRTIDQDPVLSAVGLSATWYQIPTTELELKVSVAMQAAGRDAVEIVGGVPRPALPKLWIQPVNAAFQNQFAYDVQAASTVKLTVVAVPPPGQVAAGRPVSTPAEMLAAARPFLFPRDDLAASPEDRVSVNFNAGERAWYVVQSRETPEGQVELRARVKVADDSREVLRHEP